MRTRNFPTVVATALVLLSLVAGCSGGSQGIVPAHPDFTGTWLLNADASQDPEPQGRPGGGEPSGGRPEPGASRTRTPLTADGIMPSVAFRLEEDDSTLIFSDAQGRERRVYQDGREYIEAVGGMGNLRTKAGWKGEKLVVERQLESGAKITETYELKENGRQLHVEIRITAYRTIKFTRVYDLADAY